MAAAVSVRIGSGSESANLLSVFTGSGTDSVREEDVSIGSVIASFASTFTLSRPVTPTVTGPLFTVMGS